MDNEFYKPRIVDSEIKLKLELSKAVCIQGPKACGKTWAAEHQAASEIKLGDATDNFVIGITFLVGSGKTHKLLA